MLSVFLAGPWRENRPQFFESFFLFIFVHFGKLGGQSSGMGSAELLQRFPGWLSKGKRCFLESDCLQRQRLFPLTMFVFWLFSGSLLPVPLKLRSLGDSVSVQPRAKCTRSDSLEGSGGCYA